MLKAELGKQDKQDASESFFADEVVRLKRRILEMEARLSRQPAHSRDTNPKGLEPVTDTKP